MKKFFYLMSVACLMMAASCEKDGKGNSQTPEAPVITVAEGIRTAGSDLILRADGIDADAKFYLQAGEKRIDIEAEVSTSGATVKLPYNLGEYTLYVEQEGASYEAGKITIAVTDVVLPSDAVSSGEEIVIKGNGFASDAVIVIGGKDAASSAVSTEVTLTVPELEAGTYTVSVKQVGTEQIFEGKLNVKGVVKKRLMNVTVEGMGDFPITYNGNEPATFFGTEIVKEGDVYNFAELGFTFTVNNNLISKIDVEGEEFPWEYDENGYVSLIGGQDNEYVVYVDENGNYSGDGFACKDLNLKNNPDANVDIALLNDALGNFDFAYIAAAMFGWTGKISVNIPSHVVMEYEPDTWEPIFASVTYEFDEDGYVTSYNCAEMGMLFLYTWEVVE